MVTSFNNRKINTLESSDGRGQKNNPTPVILIVDDNDDSREMLKILLQMWKYRVIEATDGIAAVKIAVKTCPDLILMDVRLPNLDGFDVTSRIRQTEKIKNVPVIFLSGCAETIYKKNAETVGGNEYLTKPLDFEKLENILGRYIHR